MGVGEFATQLPGLPEAMEGAKLSAWFFFGGFGEMDGEVLELRIWMVTHLFEFGFVG